jgi:hypothetical protein
LLLLITACGITLPEIADVVTPSTTTTTIPPPTSTTTPKPWLVPHYEATYQAPQVAGDPIVFACQAWITADRKDMANGVCYFLPTSVRVRDVNNVILVTLLGKDGLWSTPADSLPTQFWIDVLSGSQTFIYYIPNKSISTLITPVRQ